MTSAVLEAAGPATKAASGKYLTFLLGDESYGIPVLKIREIIRPMSITYVPQLPTYIKGVVNLRGKVIPIVDMRVKFDLSSHEMTDQTCVIIVEVQLENGSRPRIGFIVDGVEEVATFQSGDIEPPPNFGLQLDTGYILGMAKVRGAVKTLLDIDKVVACETLQRVEQALGR